MVRILLALASFPWICCEVPDRTAPGGSFSSRLRWENCLSIFKEQQSAVGRLGAFRPPCKTPPRGRNNVIFLYFIRSLTCNQFMGRRRLRHRIPPRPSFGSKLSNSASPPTFGSSTELCSEGLLSFPQYIQESLQMLSVNYESTMTTSRALRGDRLSTSSLNRAHASRGDASFAGEGRRRQKIRRRALKQSFKGSECCSSAKVQNRTSHKLPSTCFDKTPALTRSEGKLRGEQFIFFSRNYLFCRWGPGGRGAVCR